jgi:hypothetical protein
MLAVVRSGMTMTRRHAYRWRKAHPVKFDRAIGKCPLNVRFSTWHDFVVGEETI